MKVVAGLLNLKAENSRNLIKEIKREASQQRMVEIENKIAEAHTLIT